MEYRREDTGLVNLFGFGFRGPEAQAILSRINDRAAPFGADDERTADHRRFDAFRDLLMGRNPLPTDHTCETGCEPHDQAPCGCRPGQAAPCGTDVQVHVPLPAVLGMSDEPAEVVGHGPIEPDQLQDLLLNSHRLTPVFVDADGVPVASGQPLPPPERGDPAALREALLRLAAQSPPELHPRHPHDHQARDGASPGAEQAPTRRRDPDAADSAAAEPTTTPVDNAAAAATTPVESAAPAPATTPVESEAPAPRTAPVGGGLRRPQLADLHREDAALLTGVGPGADPTVSPTTGHPPGRAGSYQVRGRLRQLLRARAPRCEFPGCGARAVLCDIEHDLAWPQGPSCACNLGPCCRRHHRVKQQGWTKTRDQGSAVPWSTPTGRTWTSPSQHEPPHPATRGLPHLPTTSPFDDLSPLQHEEELWWLADCPDDPAGLELRATDHEPDDHDRTQRRLENGDTAWSLDLADPYAWLEPAR